MALVDELGVGPVRDLGLLETAAHRPQTSLFGEDAYPELDSKAAVLLESLTRNHALADVTGGWPGWPWSSSTG